MPAPSITEDQRALAEAEIVEQSKRIEFYITEYSVELLANKMRSGDFVVPGYQREFTWEPERKSRFIESVIMGLQIPFLFFWEMENGKLEIVDGSQRLRTLEEFVLGDLRLTELEALPKISGFKFSDLPEGRQRKIKNRSIRGIVLNEHADEQARFDMFQRINTSSKAANKAEVRRGALTGPFLSLVIELAQLPAFIHLSPVSKQLVLEREREELVTRFFAYGDGLNGYKDRPSEFLYEYSKKMNTAFEVDPALVGQYRRRFVDTIDFVAAVFPYGFRRKATGKATPRARFEAISIGSYLALKAKPALKAKKQKAGSDWSLVASFGKLVRKVDPDFVTMENVPQLEHHRVFKEFLGDLKNYHVRWDTIDCSILGVPQTRKRLVLLASKLGSEGLSLAGPTLAQTTTVRETISHLGRLSAGQADTKDPLHVACRLSALNLKRIRASLPGGTWRDWKPSLRAACHRRATGDTYPSVYGRMEWDAPSPTITTQCFGYGNGRFGHPEQDRAISLREAAMLQTFPRNYAFVREGEPIKFNRLGRMIGNAVPVRLGEVIARTFQNHVSIYRA